MNNPVSFDNTEIAFAHKTNQELKVSHRLFWLMSVAPLVKLGTVLTPWAIRTGLPVTSLIRQTIFRQFVGGETMEQSIPVIQKLNSFNVEVILDYGVEGKEGEDNFDRARDEFIRVIEFAGAHKGIPFMSVKITGFARFSLLEKIDSLMTKGNPELSLISRYQSAIATLNRTEQLEWERVVQRMRMICSIAEAAKVGFLVDAEETWVQHPIDALTMLMMDEFNRGKIIVYNTIQLYRHDRLNFLKLSMKAAEERGFMLAVKLVRGAYMEKERKRAAAMGYPSPIQADKEHTDKDYNDAVVFCLDHIERTGLIIASHNENSNLLAVRMIMEKGLPTDHAHIHFSQLFGMSDNITYNLARAGFRVSKYLPFGPIKDVIPYLMRRAQENTSVGGQTSRELSLIKKELVRRKL